MKTYFEIKIHSLGWGLFGYMSQVLGHLKMFEDSGIDAIPFVSVKNDDYGDPSEDFDAYSPFFKPLCNFSPPEIYAQESAGECKIIPSPHGDARGRAWMFGNNMWPPDHLPLLEQGIPIYKKYIRVHDSITADIDKFYIEKLEGKKTLAVHIRGLDKYIEITPTALPYIFEMIYHKIKHFGYEQVYVCTDEKRILEYLQARITEEFTNISFLKSASKRINGKRPLYVVNREDYIGNPDICYGISDSDYTNFQKGYDVIFDVFTMARCQGFLRCVSNVSDWVPLASDSIEEISFIETTIPPQPYLLIPRSTDAEKLTSMTEDYKKDMESVSKRFTFNDVDLEEYCKGV